MKQIGARVGCALTSDLFAEEDVLLSPSAHRQGEPCLENKTHLSESLMARHRWPRPVNRRDRTTSRLDYRRSYSELARHRWGLIGWTKEAGHWRATARGIKHQLD